MDLKAVYRRYGKYLQPVLYAKNRLFGVRLRLSGGENRVEGLERCRMKGVRITVSGTDNLIEIGDMSTMSGVSISIQGSHNRIVLGERAFLSGCAFCVEDDGNEITLGEHTYIYEGTELSAIEGTRLLLGKDCLLSAGIMLRTGDSHGIWNGDGTRANPSGDITVGDHVWIGRDAKVLKAARIPSGCVVGTGAVVTRGSGSAENAVYAGIPARPVKTGITWSHQRENP